MPAKDPIAEIEECMENACAAQEAGDYPAALRYMETAMMRIAILPDSELNNERLQWDRESIQNLIRYLQTKVNSTNGNGSALSSLIRPSEVTYKRG